MDDASKLLIESVRRQHALPEDVAAEEAIAAVLCVLRQRWGTAESLDALPASIRGLFRTCVLHPDEPAAVFGLDEFLRRVAEHLDVSPHGARRISRVVCLGLRSSISESEAAQVERQFPAELRALWVADAAPSPS
jgi:uncharacterized protein (DUF2267 family)